RRHPGPGRLEPLPLHLHRAGGRGVKRATVEVGWKSIPGQRHRAEGRENEDAVVVTTDHPLLDAVLLVADGMGGHALPHLAAQTAADRAREYLGSVPDAEEVASVSDLLRAAVDAANRAARELALQSGNGKAPGTTLTAAAVANGALYVAHVGDGS